MVKTSCQCCHGGNLVPFFETDNMPAHSCRLSGSFKEATSVPLGKIQLEYCLDCGFIFNACFDRELVLYDTGYEDQQCHSPTFNTFASQLVHKLRSQLGWQGKGILEIGCGKGDFLRHLCGNGINTGIGVDPSYVGDLHPLPWLRFINDYYSKRYSNLRKDALVCRHTLEHIDAPYAFLKDTFNPTDRNELSVLIEVPNTNRIVDCIAFEDIYYEHCSYFTPYSLEKLMTRLGLWVNETWLDYDGQYLVSLASHSKTVGSNKPLEMNSSRNLLEPVIDSFQKMVSERLFQWKSYMETLCDQQKSIAIWGSGSKCVAFLHFLDLNQTIDIVIDINPNRHKKYLPGSGIKISPPENLQDKKPDVVLVLNAIYLEEIKQSCFLMGIDPQFITLNDHLVC